MKARLPKRLAGTVPGPERPLIAWQDSFERGADRCRLAREQNQMHMIGHQGPGPDGDTRLPCFLCEDIQKECGVFVVPEHGAMAISALDHMVRQSRKEGPGA